MKTTSPPQAAILIDEVDRVVEFQDVASAAKTAAGESRSSSSGPVFTDEVDRVLEVSDTPAAKDAGGGAALHPAEQIPLFVDLVDSVIEFRD